MIDYRVTPGRIIEFSGGVFSFILSPYPYTIKIFEDPT